MKFTRGNPFESAPLSQNNEWQTTMHASSWSWLRRSVPWWPFGRTSRDRSVGRANGKSRQEADDRAGHPV
jgi:hypothetical protein